MQVDSETKISNFAVSVTYSLFCMFGVSQSLAGLTKLHTFQ